MQTKQETIEQLLSAGIPQDKIDAAIEEYRAKLGAAVKSDDFLVWLVAKQKFGVAVPEITTLSGGGGKGDTPIRLADVVAEASEDAYYSARGYVLETYEYEPEGKNPRRKVVLLDDSGVGTVMVWHNNLDHWGQQGVAVGDYVEFGGLQCLRISDEFVPLTFGQYSEASKPDKAAFTLEDCYEALPNADEAHVDEWEYAYVGGVVADEARHQFEQKRGMQTRMGEFHTLSVTSGGAVHTVKVPPNLAPHEDLFGHPVQIVAQWRPETYEKDGETKTVHNYRAVSLNIGGKTFDTPRNELENSVDPREATLGNVFAYIAENGASSGVKVVDIVAHFSGEPGEIDDLVQALMDSGKVYEPEFGVVRPLE